MNLMLLHIDQFNSNIKNITILMRCKSVFCSKLIVKCDSKQLKLFQIVLQNINVYAQNVYYLLILLFLYKHLFL